MCVSEIVYGPELVGRVSGGGATVEAALAFFSFRLFPRGKWKSEEAITSAEISRYEARDHPNL